jgi:hypothetical protein
VIETVRLALEAPSPVSLKALSKDLEGKIDLEVLLGVVLSSDEALTAREAQVTVSLDSLRAQLKQMPGHAPEGMLWNFARLKAERDLILAERRRR